MAVFIREFLICIALVLIGGAILPKPTAYGIILCGAVALFLLVFTGKLV